MGAVAGAFYGVMSKSFPCQNNAACGVVVSITIWFVLRLEGISLSLILPNRCVGDMREVAQ